MSIRVFVSHSTWLKPDLDARFQSQVPAHSAFLQQLCNRLNDDFKVTVDKQIPVGRLWREFLFNGMADCHAAIILVNEQALHHSPWVDAEVTVFGYRAHNEKSNFRLIVVPFGGVNGSDIVKHLPWQPMAIGDIQMLPRDGLDETDPAAVDAVIQEIVSTLKQLPRVDVDNSPSGWLVMRLCTLLKMDAQTLRTIGTSLGEDIAGVNDEAALRRRVAHALYRTGPLAVLKLSGSPECPLQNADLGQVLEIVSTYWIDMKASMGVLSCGLKSSTQQVIAINCVKVDYTPAAYVRQVCGEKNPWPVFTIDPNYDAVEQIRDSLFECPRFQWGLRKLCSRLDRLTPDEKMSFINKLIDSEHSVPVFVALSHPGGGRISDVILKITSAFPKVRVIVCTGTNEGAAILPPDIQMLFPEISLANESRAFDEYCGVGTHFGGGYADGASI